MLITVTQEHIDKGLPGESTHCPVTLAAEAAGLHNPRTSRCAMYFSRSTYSERLCQALPKKVTQFIDKFDTSPTQVKPFSFEMPLGDAE